MKKRLVLILGLVMIALFGLQAEVRAMDYVGHWARSNIEAALKKGYLNGFPDGNMKPNDGISRAEFVKLLNHSLNFSESKEIAFADVQKTDWFYPEVAVGVRAGYVNGTSAHHFQPNAPLTREQAAKMLALAERYDDTEKELSFSDAAEIATWARQAVASCLAKGVIKGTPDGKFGPKRNLTRAEAITMIEKTLEAASEHPQSVVVTKAGQSLKYRTFENVEIAKTVGNGNVYLKQVRIKGDLRVYGGGKDSIYLEDVVVDGNLIVEKEDGQIRIYVTGESSILKTVLHSGAILEEKMIASDYQGLDRIEVSTKIAPSHEVIAVGEMLFELKNQNVRIEGNGEILQEGKKTETTTKKTAESKALVAEPSVGSHSNPKRNTPEPAPAPKPAPELNANGDPIKSPLFVIGSNHSGLAMYRDHKNHNHEIEIKTLSAAAVYFVVGKSEYITHITKEHVLSGTLPQGTPEKFYKLMTQANSLSKTVIHAKPGESICLVATHATEEERLNQLELATNVRIFTIPKE